MRSAILLALLIAAQPAAAQRNRGGGACSFSFDPAGYFISPFWRNNPVYEGRVTFARIKYRGGFQCGQEGPGWAHDYWRAESHFMRILGQITSVHPFIESREIIGGAILALDEPELFKYPVAYMSEPGGWEMTPSEVKGLKQYVSRGGFMIFDDMSQHNGMLDLQVLLYEWQRAFPGAKLVELHNDHSIFNTFFKVDLAKVSGYYGPPQYFGIYENNDPKRRLLAVIDHNNDIGENIQWSDQGLATVPQTESYKLWVNYFVYALTH